MGGMGGGLNWVLLARNPRPRFCSGSKRKVIGLGISLFLKKNIGKTRSNSLTRISEDDLKGHNVNQFSIKDMDNDGRKIRNCAKRYAGTWEVSVHMLQVLFDKMEKFVLFT